MSLCQVATFSLNKKDMITKSCNCEN